MGNRQSSIVNGCCRATDGQRLGLRLFEAIFIKMKRGFVRSFRKNGLPSLMLSSNQVSPTFQRLRLQCRRVAAIRGGGVCRARARASGWCCWARPCVFVWVSGGVLVCSLFLCLCVPVFVCSCVPVFLCSYVTLLCVLCPVSRVLHPVFCVLCHVLSGSC